MSKKFQKIVIEEVRKLRRVPRDILFAYPYQINDVRKDLRLRRINFRTQPRFIQGQLVGYDIFIRKKGT